MPARRIVVRHGDVEYYVVEVLVELNSSGEVELYAAGENECVLAEVIAELRKRLPEAVITGGGVGITGKGDRRRSYLVVRLKASSGGEEEGGG